MTQELRLFVVFYGPRHENPKHSELSAIADRQGLDHEGPGRVGGGGVAIFDLGYDTAEEYRPYRIDAIDALVLARLLLAELPHHETIGLLADADRYDVSSDPFVTDDPELAAELSAKGVAVLGPDRVARAESFAEDLRRIATRHR